MGDKVYRREKRESREGDRAARWSKRTLAKSDRKIARASANVVKAKTPKITTKIVKGSPNKKVIKASVNPRRVMRAEGNLIKQQVKKEQATVGLKNRSVPSYSLGKKRVERMDAMSSKKRTTGMHTRILPTRSTPTPTLAQTKAKHEITSLGRRLRKVNPSNVNRKGRIINKMKKLQSVANG